MTINSNNIIDLTQYLDAAKKQRELEKAAEKRFPLIYALHTPAGDPLILFRFVSAETNAKADVYNNNIVSFPLSKIRNA